MKNSDKYEIKRTAKKITQIELNYGSLMWNYAFLPCFGRFSKVEVLND